MKNDDFEIKKISRRKWYAMGKQRKSVKRLRKERKQREAEEAALQRYRLLEENYSILYLSNDELDCYVNGMTASAKGFDRVPPNAVPPRRYYHPCGASPAERNWCSWLSGYDAYQMRHAINIPELVDGYAKILSKYETRSHQR